MLNVKSTDWFASSMQPFLPFKPNESIAIAVSGGADSMALALLADAWAKQHQITIVALTVDHGLRPESVEEAKQVHSWLSAKGIQHHIITWEGEKPTSNIQAIARKKRYGLLLEWCKTHKVKDLMTAHHLDDQAETVLLRLARGSGVDGLSGILASTIQADIHIIRPLLEVPKETLKAYLNEQGQEWVEDPSNQSDEYARSALRKVLETYADALLITKRLADTAHHMARVRNYLETQTEEAMRQCVTLHEEGYVTLNTPAFLALHEEIGFRLLSNLLCIISGNTEKTRFSHLETLYYKMQAGEVATLHGCKLEPKQDNYRIYREISAIPPQTTFTNGMLWDNRFIITSQSKERYAIRPLGAYSWTELYAAYPELKQSSIPKGILKTLPIVTGIENGLEDSHIVGIGEVKTGWKMRFIPVKPLN